jgi:hypothetical protein
MSEFGKVVNSMPDRIDRRSNAERVFGSSHKLHDLTGLPLEGGIGARSPDEQALIYHIPIIAERDGNIAAGVMKRKIEARMKAESEAGWREVDRLLAAEQNQTEN